MTPDERAQFDAAVSELANAAQVVAGLSTQLRQVLGTASEDALQLEAAADRIVRVLRRLQPEDRQ
jgi:ABC-type transporter Mla subunit MlaD